VLTSEGEEVLRDAGSRLGIDLVGLIRAEWKARDIEGQIVMDPSQGMSYAVMDGSTVQLFLPGPSQTMIVTLNSSPLADAFLTMVGNNSLKVIIESSASWQHQPMTIKSRPYWTVVEIKNCCNVLMRQGQV